MIDILLKQAGIDVKTIAPMIEKFSNEWRAAGEQMARIEKNTNELKKQNATIAQALIDLKKGKK